MVVTPNFGATVDKMSNLSYSDIVGAVRYGLEFVNSAVSTQPFYTEELPVLNKSLEEVMDIGDTWLSALEKTMKDPVNGIDEVELALEKALGLKDPSLLDLSIDKDTQKLYIDVNLSAKYEEKLPLDLDLGQLAAMAHIALPADFTKVLDVSGKGDIQFSVGAGLNLRLGVTLPNASGQQLDIKLEDYNPTTGKGTHLGLDARLVATNLDLGLKLGPLDVGVSKGMIVLDADGKPETNAPASLQVALIGGKPTFDLTGAFDMRLPLGAAVFGKPVNIGEVRVQTNPTLGTQGVAGLVNQLAGVADPKAPDAIVVTLPNFDLAQSSENTLIQMLYDPGSVLDGVDVGLGVVQDALQSGLSSDIPFIGSKLNEAGQVIGSFRAGLLQDLRIRLEGQGKPVELIRQGMFDVFNGLHILLDMNKDGAITVNDIDVAFYDVSGKRVATWAPGAPLPTGALDSIKFDMDLGGRILATGIDIPLNLDIPNLSLAINGGFGLEANWHFDFGLGLSVTKGFYLGTNADPSKPEFGIDLKAFLDGAPLDPDRYLPFAASGTLLFFKADLIDKDTDLKTPGFQPSFLSGALGINLTGDNAGVLNLERLISQPADSLSLTLDVDTKLRLGAALTVAGGGAGLPKLKADLNVDWDWSLGDNTVTIPKVSIENLRVDLGSVVTDLMNPISQRIY
ncbi:MAG: hypothetical protein ACR2HF_01380, partial [Methylococcaceae bacterium]